MMTLPKVSEAFHKVGQEQPFGTMWDVSKLSKNQSLANPRSSL
jgi:hypothetical protein